MKNKKLISLVVFFVLIFSFINYIKLDTNTFAKDINNYSCDYYESYEPTEVCENVRAIFSKYDIDNEDNLLMVGCNKDYILDFSLVGNAIGDIKIYRLYNPNDGDHLLTTSINELGKLVKLGWECKDNVTGTDIDILYTIRTKEKK